WAEQPPYLTVTGNWNQYISPAQNEAAAVQEYLQTDVFDAKVLGETPYRDQLLSPVLQLKVLNDLRRYASILPVSEHLVTVGYSDPNPQVAVQVVNAIIKNFNAQMLTTLHDEGTVALTFYQQQLAQAEANLASDTAQLKAYFDAHPELGTLPQSQVKMLALVADARFQAQYPQAIKMISAQQDAMKRVQNLKTQVQQIQFQQSSSVTGQPQMFRIMDPAAPPLQPLGTLKWMAMRVGLSAIAGVVLALLGLIIFTLLDPTVRSTSMIIQTFPTPAVAAAPRLRIRRGLLFLFKRKYRCRDIYTLLALEATHPSLRRSHYPSAGIDVVSTALEAAQPSQRRTY
ncbi:MAG: hypothetical protein M1396_03240, partial [Chloroflexi bacterium]|nr:hypothetical protein [Chloroflexota bacterium]